MKRFTDEDNIDFSKDHKGEQMIENYLDMMPWEEENKIRVHRGELSFIGTVDPSNFNNQNGGYKVKTVKKCKTKKNRKLVLKKKLKTKRKTLKRKIKANANQKAIVKQKASAKQKASVKQKKLKKYKK